MDKWITSIATNPALNGWGVAIFTLITVLFAVVISGIIGLEREFHGHAAGLRTHILIAVGASLIMTLSIYAFPEGKHDPSRLAAQVVSGIGFIGAGTIMQTGTDIKGLTTAASLWLCGGIGLACGAGRILEALITALVAIAVLLLLTVIERQTSKRDPRIVMIIDSNTPAIHEVLEIAEKFGVSIKDIKSQMLKYRQTDCLKVTVLLQRSSKAQITSYAEELRTRITPYDLAIS